MLTLGNEDSGGDDDDASQGDSGQLLDVGDGQEGGGEEGGIDGCTKVDLLFVVDNSDSMASNQSLLAEAAPAFVTAIRTVLTDVDDYHIGVVTSDAYEFNEPGCQSLGALVTQTGGDDSSDTVCGPFAESGARYLTQDDDLEEKFPCLLKVGTSGLNVDELIMGAMTTALTDPDLTGPGGCNEGFHRDDSLLILVGITDEPEYSEGDAQTWFNQIVALQGAEQNVVPIAITWDGHNPARMCTGVGRNPDMREFAGMFSNGVVGDVCQEYAPLFTDTVSVVDTACDEFVPVG